MRLGLDSFYLIPITLECFSQAFDDIVATSLNRREILDFSRPGRHTYKLHNLTLSFPNMPEDDGIAAYTHKYRPATGDLVFDVGAHAGFTTCVFASMVGPSGRVIAFEPDCSSCAYLEHNVQDLGFENVTIVPRAMDALSGRAAFNADGTMGAGLVTTSLYSFTAHHVVVETISLKDAAHEFGVPQFIKMDIEGAEVGIVKASETFLRENAVELAFDSYHKMRDGRYTRSSLEPMLKSFGYQVSSSSEFGQMFTWAGRS